MPLKNQVIGEPRFIWARHNLTLYWSGNRLELLIVTPTLPAITDLIRQQIDIHKIMGWHYP